MAGGSVAEIACDESGSEGDNLIGGETDVFAYASVRLDTTRAADCIRQIRARIGSPAQEYKANHLLRPKNRPVLQWLLGPSGPIHGYARVHLTDKALFVFITMVEMFVEEGTGPFDAAISPERAARARVTALTLYRAGRATWGRRSWLAFLMSFNNLLRVRNRPQLKDSIDGFFHLVGQLRHTHPQPADLGEIMERLWQARPAAGGSGLRLLGSPETIRTLDPLSTALVRTVVYWSEQLGPVSVIHDQQALLTEERVAAIKEVLGLPGAARTGHPPEPRLASLTFVDSRTDPRVQIADFLAGIARTVASAGLNQRGDEVLANRLTPYVDRLSIWAGD